MPELPEVERARKLVEDHCVGHQITAVWCFHVGGPDDVRLEDGLKTPQLTTCLQGRRVVAAHRRGKHLWFELSGSGPWPMFHFGMTGAFTVQGIAPQQFMDFTVDPTQWPPQFTKLQLRFSNGRVLAFSDPRGFGKIRLRADPLHEPPVSLLGPDPIMDPFPLEPFKKALAKTRATIKAVLLDQERAVCGIGNWIADEVLYQSAIYPGTPANSLTDHQVQTLHTRIVEVCTFAVQVNAHSPSFPADWLFHYRWFKGRVMGDRLPNGSQIKWMTCASRTTAWVPDYQRPPTSKDSPRQKSSKPNDNTTSQGDSWAMMALSGGAPCTSRPFHHCTLHPKLNSSYTAIPDHDSGAEWCCRSRPKPTLNLAVCSDLVQKLLNPTSLTKQGPQSCMPGFQSQLSLSATSPVYHEAPSYPVHKSNTRRKRWFLLSMMFAITFAAGAFDLVVVARARHLHPSAGGGSSEGIEEGCSSWGSHWKSVGVSDTRVLTHSTRHVCRNVQQNAGGATHLAGQQPIVRHLAGQQPIVRHLAGQQPIVRHLAGQQPVVRRGVTFRAQQR